MKRILLLSALLLSVSWSHCSLAQRVIYRPVPPEVTSRLIRQWKARLDLAPTAKTHGAAWAAEVVNRSDLHPAQPLAMTILSGESLDDVPTKFASMNREQQDYILAVCLLAYQYDNSFTGALEFVLQQLDSTIRSVAAHQLGPAATALTDDVVTIAMEKVFSNADQYDFDTANPSAWIRSITRNAAKDELRKLASRTKHEGHFRTNQSVTELDSPLSMRDAYDQYRLRRCLQLSADSYRVGRRRGNPKLAALIAEGANPTEISRELGLSRTTVMKHREAFRKDVLKRCGPLVPEDYLGDEEGTETELYEEGLLQ